MIGQLNESKIKLDSNEFFIPGNVPSSKNSKIFTGKYLVWSKAAQKYRKDTKYYWLSLLINYKKERNKYIAKYGYPIKMSFKFIRSTKHKFDYVNPLQTILDLMVENNWLSDDNSDIILPVFEKYEYDKNNSGVIIKFIQ